ncbi:MAG: beta-ketoacyl-[acyl-carrier-protein] synthase II, partial [Acidobacteriota bacterium]|nr:beta-ketoacyl-[acyl-carrier-protein] synthase II [Acidobacteriota bacterium]
GLTASDVGHVNAHGTSTILNDKTEALAMHKLLGSRAGDVTVTALKSMTGHAIAGSGAMETAALAISYRESVLTPTINYEFPDPECDVNVVANKPIEADPGVSLKLSYGFGGHNSCLVLTPV